MARSKQPWHRGTHQARARKVVAAAAKDPATTCWRCGRTRHEHPARHKTGRPARWTAGHVTDSTVNGELRPEWSTCNYQAGARKRAAAMRGKPLKQTRRSQPSLNTSRPW